MKKKILLVILFFFFFSFFSHLHFSFAEVKMDSSRPDGGEVIPKIPKTANDPILRNGGVYPMWGPVCQRYTYHTIYQDKKGRPPEYIRMFFNGKWIDVQKENPNDNDYKKGVRYIYKFVPNKLGSNFFFFEASNGLGKTREGIIDSPGNGPVLFEGDFLHNEIALIESKTAKKIWTFPIKEEWVGGLAMSDNGKYLAAQTSSRIYFFDTNSFKPLWEYGMSDSGTIGGDVKGGVAISADGGKIFASLGNSVYLFDKKSGQPIWQAQTGSNSSYNVAISADGKYMAAATAGEEANLNSNLLILWNEKSAKPLWQYHASGNFHDVALSKDGSYIVGATGCPDRRAYIFSKNSSEPILRSEMLTRDSPVDEARISADGSMAVFGTESDQGSIVLFNKNSNQPIWRFPAPLNASFRAVAITSNGKYLGGSTFKGDVYLFSKDSKEPLNHWKENASMGSFDLSDDGTIIAVGGADNKVHIYNKNIKEAAGEVILSEYVGEIDVSANGKYVAAGTSGSVYFFETFTSNEGKLFPCTTIIEPKPMNESLSSKDNDSSLNIPINSPLLTKEKEKLSGGAIIGGIGLISPLLILGIYLFLIKFNFFNIRQGMLYKHKKIIIIGFLILIVLFTIIVIVFVFTSRQNKQNIMPQENKAAFQDEGKGKNGICGNNLCEPNLGESKQNCPKDCSGDN